MASAPHEDQKIDISRTISRGIETITGQFVPYLGLSVLLAGVPTAAASWFLAASEAGGDPWGGLTAYLGMTLLSLVTTALLQAAIIRSAILTMSDRPADVGGSIARALSLVLPLIGLSILTGIIVTIGMIALIVPGIIAYVVLSVAVPAMVEERLGIIASMERSAALTKGTRNRIFLLLLLMGVAYFIFAAVLGGIGVAVGMGNQLLVPIVEGIAAALTSLAAAGLIASLYIELRTVKEGATTEGLVAIFE